VVAARIAALAHVVPAPIDQEDFWRDHFAACYGDDGRAARVWRSAGVDRRHCAVDPRELDVSAWSTGQRMARYMVEALPLGKGAVAGAVSGAGIAASDLGLFAVASCTGYGTPGLDVTLARDLGMGDAVQRIALGHMGCYAAIPGLGAAADFVRSRGRAAALLCCELPSMHLQAPVGKLTREGLEQLAVQSLFADAASAVVLVPDGQGLEFVDIAAYTDSTTAELMTWQITDHGFRMGLSSRVPDVLARFVRPVVDELLARHGTTCAAIAGWAVHPGGPRILDVVADRLGIGEGAVAVSREVLRDYGNCSSATVLMVLERLLAQRPFEPGELVMLLAFGPGLTLYAALLRQSDPTPR